jgi:hypothetical protein
MLLSEKGLDGLVLDGRFWPENAKSVNRTAFASG